MGDGKFKPGPDPRRNAGGRPSMSDEDRKAFEEMGPIALSRLRKILEGSDNAQALRAIDTVFERLWGKAVQPTDNKTTLAGEAGEALARIVRLPRGPGDDGPPA